MEKQIDKNTKLGFSTLVVAFVLGIFGDTLLRATPWGLNIFLWTLLLMASVVMLAHWRGIALIENRKWPMLTIILFSALFVCRDSLTLKVLDGLAVFITLSLVTMQRQPTSIRLASISNFVLDAVNTVLNALFGTTLMLSQDIQWKDIQSGELLQRTKAVGLGCAIALPLLIIFGGLFSEADSVFQGIVNNTFVLIFDNLFTHIFLIVLCTWLVGGLLRAILAGNPMRVTLKPHHERFTLGIIEISIVLGLLNLLFLCFVIVQFTYFFGGQSVIRESIDLTYAEYARRGFFELIAVAALVLPLLLIMHWLLRKAKPSHERFFQALAVMQVAMLFVIMFSAFKRMQLYQEQYGLTELRLYTTAFMGWLAVVFIWFIATVLYGKRERFAFGALVSSFLMVVCLHAFNPDAFIVQVNASRIKSGHSFDTYYAASLSADAVPELIKVLPKLNLQERHLLVNRTLRPGPSAVRFDWRTWNWGRFKARRLVQASKDSLLLGREQRGKSSEMAEE